MGDFPTEITMPLKLHISCRPSQRTTLTWGVVLLAFASTLSACAAGSAEARQSVDGGLLAQFLLGVWHGIIAPAILLLEVTNRVAPKLLPWTAQFYEVRGTQVEYDVGFYIGLTCSPIFAWTRWSSRSRIVD